MNAERTPVSEWAELKGLPNQAVEDDDAYVLATYISADHDEIQQLLYDPLELIRKHDPRRVIGSADDGWSVTLTRTGAEIAIPVPPVPPLPAGPHHLICLWLVLPGISSVVLLAHRSAT